VYWTGGNYIGLGPSAASHIDGHRWKNRPHLGEWEQAIDAHTLPADDVEHLSPPVRAGELAMLMLRLETGIEYETFAQRLGIDARSLFAEPAERLAKLGYVETNERGIRLTERGIPVADAVAGEFLRHAAGD
jgi:oxygen-independent coproporphyrinogen-3 oxidase